MYFFNLCFFAVNTVFIINYIVGSNVLFENNVKINNKNNIIIKKALFLRSLYRQF